MMTMKTCRKDFRHCGSKGTGKWTSINALELGIPLTIITESVFARFISSIKQERVNASKELNGPKAEFTGNKEEFLEKIRKALYMSKICSYAQGFAQMRKASEENEWNLKLGDLAMIWREGCIIRAQFLQKLKTLMITTQNYKTFIRSLFQRYCYRISRCIERCSSNRCT